MRIFNKPLDALIKPQKFKSETLWQPYLLVIKSSLSLYVTYWHMVTSYSKDLFLLKQGFSLFCSLVASNPPVLNFFLFNLEIHQNKVIFEAQMFSLQLQPTLGAEVRWSRGKRSFVCYSKQLHHKHKTKLGPMQVSGLRDVHSVALKSRKLALVCNLLNTSHRTPQCLTLCGDQRLICMCQTMQHSWVIGRLTLPQTPKAAELCCNVQVYWMFSFMPSTYIHISSKYIPRSGWYISLFLLLL